MNQSVENQPANWIDPFCPLLSDRVGVLAGDPPLPGNPDARRTADALAHFSSASLHGAPAALVDGEPSSLDEAVATAARLIGGWRQPLFGGLGTDVAGARALTRLALRCGAILDHGHGQAMTQALRALQDRGGFTCTLSEIRNRADLILCIGVNPVTFAPDFFQRCGIGEAVPAAPASRQVVFLQAQGAAITTPHGLADAQVETVHLPGSDLHCILAELNAACDGRTLLRGSPDWPRIQSLAARLRDARFAVLIHAPSQLPGAHAALLIEVIGRIVKSLNRTTRAGSLALGGADGGATLTQTVTWLTGLPLRTALHSHGFDHDPHRYSARRLLASGAADGLLWISSFSPDLMPPAGAGNTMPAVTLGHPAMLARMRDHATAGTGASGSVFIAVATPGVNAQGHLFRADGGIVLALKPFMPTALPGVAVIVQRLLELLPAGSSRRASPGDDEVHPVTTGFTP